MRMLIGLGVLMCVAIGSPVMADKPDYCAAYARDFADARSKDKPMWQHKYDIALAACMAEPKQAETIKPAIVKKRAEKAEAPQDIPPEPKIAETSVPARPAKLVAGTAAWNDYCSNKYTSFNVKTGTYKSRTGVERKCLVN